MLNLQYIKLSKNLKKGASVELIDRDVEYEQYIIDMYGEEEHDDWISYQNKTGDTYIVIPIDEYKLMKEDGVSYDEILAYF